MDTAIIINAIQISQQANKFLLEIVADGLTCNLITAYDNQTYMASTGEASLYYWDEEGNQGNTPALLNYTYLDVLPQLSMVQYGLIHKKHKSLQIIRFAGF